MLLLAMKFQGVNRTYGGRPAHLLGSKARTIGRKKALVRLNKVWGSHRARELSCRTSSDRLRHGGGPKIATLYGNSQTFNDIDLHRLRKRIPGDDLQSVKVEVK
jgi:hypothetical protein